MQVFSRFHCFIFSQRNSAAVLNICQKHHATIQIRLLRLLRVILQTYVANNRAALRTHQSFLSLHLSSLRSLATLGLLQGVGVKVYCSSAMNEEPSRILGLSVSFRSKLGFRFFSTSVSFIGVFCLIVVLISSH